MTLVFGHPSVPMTVD
jgi:acyl-coenzyme A synthetase/AMP-(fatty) acid ligase